MTNTLRSIDFELRDDHMSNWSTSDWPDISNPLQLEHKSTSGRGTARNTHRTWRSNPLRNKANGEHLGYRAFTLPFIGNAIGRSPFSGIDNSIICSIQLAIHESILKSEKEPKRDLLVQDFENYESTFYPRSGSDKTPKHDFPDFKFSVFAPVAFRYFRNTFQIHSLDYVHSVCSQPLVPLSNPGSSGSILYVTSDDRFILKSVQKREAVFLTRLIPGYYLNVIQNRQTLLPKFFGMYAFSSRSQKVRFIVMNNLIPSDIRIDLRFDLKGSTFKRYASDSERNKPNPTLKDLDFCHLFGSQNNGAIRLNDHTRDALLRTMTKDCRVLQSFSIMDYSLLLAIHKCSASSSKHSIRNPRIDDLFANGNQNGNQEGDSDPNSADISQASHAHRIPFLTSMGSIAPSGYLDEQNKSSPNSLSSHTLSNKANRLEHGADFQVQRSPSVNTTVQTPYGGIPAFTSTGERMFIFIGIIDILQSYNTRKRLEHVVKSTFIAHPKTISVIEPSAYCRRFLKFMSSVVFRPQASIEQPVGENLGRIAIADPECSRLRKDSPNYAGDTIQSNPTIQWVVPVEKNDVTSRFVQSLKVNLPSTSIERSVADDGVSSGTHRSPYFTGTNDRMFPLPQGRPIHSISTSTIDNDSGYPSVSSTTVRTFVRNLNSNKMLPKTSTLVGDLSVGIADRVDNRCSNYGHILLVDSTSL